MDKQAMTLMEWYDGQFMPWKQAAAQYLDGKAQAEAQFAKYMGQLQTIVALLLDGKTRQAVLAWNTLNLVPALASAELDVRRDVLTLVQPSGQKITLQLDDVLEDLQNLLDAREVVGAEPA